MSYVSLTLSNPRSLSFFFSKLFYRASRKANYEILVELDEMIIQQKSMFHKRTKLQPRNSYLCKIIRSHLYLRNYDIFFVFLLFKLFQGAIKINFSLHKKKRESVFMNKSAFHRETWVFETQTSVARKWRSKWVSEYVIESQSSNALSKYHLLQMNNV